MPNPFTFEPEAFAFQEIFDTEDEEEIRRRRAAPLRRPRVRPRKPPRFPAPRSRPFVVPYPWPMPPPEPPPAPSAAGSGSGNAPSMEPPPAPSAGGVPSPSTDADTEPTACSCPAPGAEPDAAAQEFWAGEDEYSAFESEYETSATPTVNLASAPCPVHSPGRTTDRCQTPQTCPAIPNLLCVTAVNDIPFEYVAGKGMIRRDATTGFYRVDMAKSLKNHKQRFIPAVGQALGGFLANMTRFGMPVETILTAGSLYCRCITGTNTLSNHSFGDAIDVVGVRWRAPNGLRETLVHNYANPAERAILRRINACLRLSFATTIDYHRSDHRDHFHCDMNRGRGRVLRGKSTVAFVQEALNLVGGQQLRGGHLDNATKKALSAFSGRSVQELANNTIYSRALDDLFARVARG